MSWHTVAVSWPPSWPCRSAHRPCRALCHAPCRRAMCRSLLDRVARLLAVSWRMLDRVAALYRDTLSSQAMRARAAARSECRLALSQHCSAVSWPLLPAHAYCVTIQFHCIVTQTGKWAVAHSSSLHCFFFFICSTG